MDNIQQPSDPEKARPLPTGNGNRPRGEKLDTGYQSPEDHELSPEVQLAWFELNREETQRAYVRAMRIGGLIGAVILPILVFLMHYVQTFMDVLIGLAPLHENPVTSLIYWSVIGVFAGFLGGVGLAALGLWLLQRFQ